MNMYTIQHIKVENGIHWVTSIIHQFENIYNVSNFPYKKELSNDEYLIINKTENVFTT